MDSTDGNTLTANVYSASHDTCSVVLQVDFSAEQCQGTGVDEGVW